MMYRVRVFDGMNVHSYGPWRNKKEARKGRTAAIKAGNNYLKSKGWTRMEDGDSLIFMHAVWATVVISIVEV